MVSRSPFRLPLSTGGSPASLMLGVALVGFAGASPVFLGSVLPQWVAVLCGFLIAGWFCALVALPWMLKRQRASDILLCVDGAAVEAGPLRGRQWGWEALGSPRIQRGRYENEVVLLVGQEVLARSEEPAEVESLKALGETLVAVTRGEAAEEPAWKDVSAEVAHCETCGAPLVITKGPSVSCIYCGEVAVLSDELAALVTEVHALEASNNVALRSVEILSRWPSAARVNRVLLAATLPLVLGWPAAAVFASEYFQHHDILSWRDVGTIYVGTFAFTLALVLWVQGQVAHRRAFALLVAGFSARVLDAERNLLGCRVCGAPLGARADKLVATCIYCRSESLLDGLDIPVHRHVMQARSLRALAAERVRSTRTWRGLGIAAFFAALAGIALLAGPVQRAVHDDPPRHPPIDRTWSYEPPR